MSKKRKVAPLLRQNKNSDEEYVPCDILNDIFSDLDGKDEPLNKNDFLVDLDDWKCSLDVSPQDDVLKKSINPTGKTEKCAVAHPPRFEELPINKTTRKLSVVNTLNGSSNNDGPFLKNSKGMFTSREYDEDTTLQLRFLKRNVPASEIRELKVFMTFVPLAAAAKFSEPKRWFTAGVVTGYSALKTSNGAKIELNDLGQDPYSMKILLFNPSSKTMATTLILGTIVCLKSPSKGKPYNGVDSLIIKSDDQILIAGSSRDYGLCGAKKKNGGLCQNVVNLNKCRLCNYHSLSAYKQKQMSGDLRAAQGIGLGVIPRNSRSLQKSNIGKSTSRASSMFNVSRARKDAAILGKLTEPTKSKIQGKGEDSSTSQVGGPVSSTTKRKFEVMIGESKNGIFSPSSETWDDKLKKNSMKSTPEELSPSISRPLISPNNRVSAAKKRALTFARQSGGISPSTTKNKSPKLLNDCPKTKSDVITPEFIALMNAKPKNPALLAEAEAKEQDKRFDKLKVMEEVSEKLAKTHEIPVRVVRCVVCKKNYSKLPLECVQKNHNCRIVKGKRRFFECVRCHHRTSTLERLPLTECGKCGGGDWKRAGVAAERICRNIHQLSVRGNEEKFMGSVVTDPNLALLVPDVEETS